MQQVRLRGLCIDAQQFSWQFLAFGEVVTPPCSAPPVLPLFGRRYHTPFNPRNKSLHMSYFPISSTQIGQ